VIGDHILARFLDFALIVGLAYIVIAVALIEWSKDE